MAKWQPEARQMNQKGNNNNNNNNEHDDEDDDLLIAFTATSTKDNCNQHTTTFGVMSHKAHASDG